MGDRSVLIYEPSLFLYWSPWISFYFTKLNILFYAPMEVSLKTLDEILSYHKHAHLLLEYITHTLLCSIIKKKKCISVFQMRLSFIVHSLLALQLKKHKKQYRIVILPFSHLLYSLNGQLLVLHIMCHNLQHHYIFKVIKHCFCSIA